MKRISKAEKWLIAVFLVTLPFIKVQVDLDGVAYYAVARSLVVDHNLQFKGDWKQGAPGPSFEVRDSRGRVVVLRSTQTGHLPIHSAIGASLLWMPFIAATHAGVLVLDRLGATIPANGFSKPYLVTLAVATSLYALMGLWMSFRLAREYFEERWAFLAMIALWLASSLPAYIYVEPAWSHAHSVFAVALFLWYWNRTRGQRTLKQWLLLGLIAGLMVEVYFPNCMLLFVLVAEFYAEHFCWQRDSQSSALSDSVRNYLVFAFAILVAFSPTLIIRLILFGNPLAGGAYANHSWNWTSPALLKVLFSPAQGLLTTTPILIPAIVGIFLLYKRDGILGLGLALAFSAFCFLIASYPFWNLGPAFGNRYFISLTPAFILGLALILSQLAHRWRNPRAFARRAWAVAAILMLWNIGLVFQWMLGLMPDEGPIYWQEVLYNEFRVVPGEAIRSLRTRFSLQSQQDQQVDRQPDREE